VPHHRAAERKHHFRQFFSGIPKLSTQFFTSYTKQDPGFASAPSPRQGGELYLKLRSVRQRMDCPHCEILMVAKGIPVVFDSLSCEGQRHGEVPESRRPTPERPACVVKTNAGVGSQSRDRLPKPSRPTYQTVAPGRSPPHSGFVQMSRLAPRCLGDADTLHFIKNKPVVGLQPPLIGFKGGEHGLSSPTHRVVNVRNGLLSHVRADEKWRRAQLASALSNVLLAVVKPEIVSGVEKWRRRTTVTGRRVGEVGGHRQHAES
jgi:hypothetical protein